ncbi:CRISPR-associated protein [Actinobaculum suis]|uniref:type I-E CRISPR-associated protein Cas5/CasD n=1 Tax=Actinobaculum suis TaxID=1657 RepID=UPI00066FD0E4|nr:type I-E CRISPR-associated protein Cas5/CasD [Actinobaculum suis]KMY23343.1 CRISPR-associated protein [Actinobaculum suis]
MDCLYIRLAAPLQSWAGPAVAGNIVRTERFPTRSGLKGLLAGALGARRGAWPSWLDEAEFWVRQDRKPYLTDDFQTINPREESEEFRRRMIIIQGQRVSKKTLVFTPDARSGTSIVNRTYLADGEFLVRIAVAGKEDEMEDALSSPAFATYLGRKAFAPEFPFYLGRGSANAFTQIPAPLLAHQEANTAQRPLTCVLYGPHTSPQGERTQNLVPVVATQKERLEKISELLDIRRPLNARA